MFTHACAFEHVQRDEERRNIFQAEVGEHYPPHTLVFLDEAACNKRSKAWAPKGDRACQHDFFVWGTRCISIFNLMLPI
ncbi:hypothetical protein EDB89DRAFT_1857656 [Lactarius sanguifluus]|nr:hypothetical protein EDB89DRAFT_1857656 [Lactarius sanguifluus]